MKTIITIDSPVARLQKMLAQTLSMAFGSLYVDADAFYRAVALYLLETGGSPWVQSDRTKAAAEAQVEFARTDDGRFSVRLGGVDVTERIFSDWIGEVAAEVAKCESASRVVRERLREWVGDSAEQRVIVVGSRVGNDIFPDAAVKLFLTHSPQARLMQGFAAGRAIPVIEPDERRELQGLPRLVVLDEAPEGARILDTARLSFEEIWDRAVGAIAIASDAVEEATQPP